MTLTSRDWLSFISCGSFIRIEEDKYLVGWGKRTWQEKMPGVVSPLFYFPDFFLSYSSPWFQHEHTSLTNYDDLIQHMPAPPSLKTLSWKNPYMKDFEEAFHDLQRHFANGSLKKAVPYVFDETPSTVSKALLHSALAKILAYTRSQKMHLYGFWDEQEGMLGASPEILFKYKIDGKGLIETVAVAGTKNNTDKTDHFMKDPKEVFEHQIVVEGICESLTPFGDVKTGALQILKLPKLSHLMTPIEVEAKGRLDFESLVNALHPTPALGAFPKKEGMDWLKTYQQKVPRERYGAPLGCIFERGKQAKCIVGIRNVQWNSHGARIGAGCGVIVDSHLEKECQEIGLKISSIKEMMSL